MPFNRWLTKHGTAVWTAILVVGILFQAGFVMREYALPWGWRAKQVWNQPSLLRSADLSLGAQARRIVSFVDQVVPEQATILLPPGQTEERFSLARSMQYFFFPRQLIECQAEGATYCQDALASPDIYVLGTDDFPPPSAADRNFLAPKDDLGWFRGVYGPDFRPPQPEPGFSWLDQTGVLVRDLLLLLGLGLLGGSLLGAIRPNWQPIELLGLAVPVGAGVLTWSLFLLSWVGLKLTLSVSASVLVVITVIAAWSAHRQGHALWKLGGWREGWSGTPGVWRALISMAGLGITTVAVALSVGASYRLYDPVQIWSVKGYGIAAAGSILAGADWGVHGLSYPLNIPMQVALFYMVDGDTLPGSKLLYPIYAFALCASLFAFLRRKEVDERIAGLGALLLGTVPIVFFHATSGFANLPFTLLLVSGALWGVEGIRGESRRQQLLSGLLLGLAAWTRPEGILYALAVILILFAVAKLAHQRGSKLAPLIAPVAVVAGGWFLFALLEHTLQGSNLQQAVSVYSGDTFAGHFDPSGLWTIVRIFTYSMFVPYRAMFPAISATYWGVLFPVVLVLLVWSGRRFFTKSNLEGLMLWATLIGVGAINVGVFYIRSYSKSNFPAFIERAFPRAFLPTAVLMTVLAFWGLGMIIQEKAREEPRDTALASCEDLGES